MYAGPVNNQEGKPMTKLIFKENKNKDLRGMLAWAATHRRRIPYTEDYTDEHGLWLVKDDGIYLMASTDEKYVNQKGVVNTVVYARGYKPTKANRDTLWDKTHAVSGDDFAEFIALNPEMAARVMEGFPIEIGLTSSHISIAV